MLQRLGSFFYPHMATIAIFLALLLLMPVLYIDSEPERTNYLPGEKQRWITKSQMYPSVFNEYLFHTEGDPDILLGIIVRDYYANHIGIPLLVLYYTLACGIVQIIRNVR